MRYSISDPRPMIAERGWSIREVARRLDVVPQTLYGYLDGRRPCPIKVALDLARLLDLSHERCAMLVAWFETQEAAWPGPPHDLP